MPPLRRHQLAHLTADGWAQVLDRDWDAVARDCLHHWSQRRLPLVVTRQSPRAGFGDGLVALGLPAPLAWERRRLALQVPAGAIAWLDEFPAAQQALRAVPARARPRVGALLERLASTGAAARTYGSHGWQLISGHACVHGASDLDLWVAVDGELQADAVAACLQAHAPARPRVDGELLFIDGAAVAWREWAAWRAGRTTAVLVKRLHGASLEHVMPPAWTAMPCAA